MVEDELGANSHDAPVILYRPNDNVTCHNDSVSISIAS
jgi:hypothetical protein